MLVRTSITEHLFSVSKMISYGLLPHHKRQQYSIHIQEDFDLDVILVISIGERIRRNDVIWLAQYMPESFLLTNGINNLPLKVPSHSFSDISSGVHVYILKAVAEFSFSFFWFSFQTDKPVLEFREGIYKRAT